MMGMNYIPSTYGFTASIPSQYSNVIHPSMLGVQQPPLPYWHLPMVAPQQISGFPSLQLPNNSYSLVQPPATTPANGHQSIVVLGNLQVGGVHVGTPAAPVVASNGGTNSQEGTCSVSCGGSNCLQIYVLRF